MKVITNILKIKDNNDWTNLPEGRFVDISNDSYFGFRAMEKESKGIIYNPFEINNFERIIKDGKRFKDVEHIFEIDLTFFPKKELENKISIITRKIADTLKINPDITLNLLFSKPTEGEIEGITKVFFVIYDIPFGFEKKDLISADIDPLGYNLIKEA